MIDDKFLESFEVNDWQVETEDGWKDITHSNKTKPFVVWKITTQNFELMCADNHIVIDENKKQIFVKDLKIEQKIFTKNGLEQVTNVECLNFEEEMYDLSVDSENHTYFTSGILSHNTTIASICLLHYVIFNEFKKVVIMANKEVIALEIMQRIKIMYESLPLWMQVGVSKWNESSIVLSNGSMIEAFATSKDGIRGKTGNILFLDEFAFIEKNKAKDFMDSVYPVISSGNTTKVIIVSTPNGMNQFYDLWTDAVKGKNQYFPIKIHWWEHPNRNDEFKENMIRDRGIQFFLQEFSCGKFDSMVSVKDKESGLIKNVTFEELYKYSKSIFKK